MVNIKSLASLILFVIAIQPIFTLGSSNALDARQEPPQGKRGALSPAINIEIETERKQIEPGSSIGGLADITNNSDAPIYLREKDVEFVLPTEVERGTWAWPASFLTEYTANQIQVETPSILLKPNETYRVFWFRDPKPAQTTSGYSPLRWYQVINFKPGAYPISVLVKYWDHKKFDGDDYHTAVREKTADFVAPEWVILVGAVLGGLLFAFVTLVRAEQAEQKITKKLATLVGSILLSVIITILLSRIAETQFFIKVSISDIWGGIAVGFLANYAGWALLDKMVPQQKSLERSKE